jgi:hypothetical protein
MPQNIFDASARNIELIVELMDIVGVHDCEELTDKVRALVLQRRPTPCEDAGAFVEACSATVHVFLKEKAGHNYCYKCGERLHS